MTGAAESTESGTEPPLNLATLIQHPLLIVAAHQDDEAIGAGSRLNRFKRPLALIHVTDGAPRNGQDAHNAGFSSWADYSAARCRETARAMEMAPITCDYINLGIPDQQAIHNLERVARQLSETFRKFRPAVVLTHSYEGGHPDHDSTALCVHAATKILSANREHAPRIAEFASYHAAPEGIEVECFLNEQTPANGFHLSEEEREQKLRLFACYETQQHILQAFPCKREPIRWAPQYDFTQPPHPGKLFYEQFDWGADGSMWRELASVALQNLFSGTCL